MNANLELQMLRAYSEVFARQKDTYLIDAVNRKSYGSDFVLHESGTVTYVMRLDNGDVYLGTAKPSPEKRDNDTISQLADAIEMALTAYADSFNPKVQTQDTSVHAASQTHHGGELGKDRIL